MKIIDILKQDQITLSFEVFPPKKIEKYDSVQAATEGVAALHPSFMSVTYGAGGGTSEFTLNIAKNIRDKYGVEVLPHLTCVSSTKAHVHEMIQKFKEYGFENVMALRGDIPEGGAPYDDYHYASELVADIKSQGDFCIGGACYPDGHVECAHKDDDIRNLKRKVDAGVDFLTTQMFFDNAEFFNFLYRLREQDIRVPVLAGIMPITNQKQLGRSVALSGTTVPTRFKEIVDKFGEHPEAMKQAGIAYATGQIIDLISNGFSHVHIYTMNRPEIIGGIMANLSEIVKD